MNRPTTKMYNNSVNAADNWRKNYDAANAEATYWATKFNQAIKNHAIFFVAGVLAGVLGCLIWASIV